MIFDAAHGHAILAGTKTTHRIPAHHDTGPVTRMLPRRFKPCPYRQGDEHPLSFPQIEADSYGQVILGPDNQPRRTMEHPARIRIARIRLGHVGALDANPAALKAEGWTTLEQYALAWIARHDPSRDMQAAARRQLLGEPVLEDPVDHWRDRHAWRPCWVLHLTVAYPDTVRLLANQAGTVDAGSYTSRRDRAIPDEPEAVDPRIVATLPSSLRATQLHALGRLESAAAFETLPLAEKIRRLQALAAENHVDISGPLKEIERQTRRAMGRLGRRAA